MTLEDFAKEFGVTLERCSKDWGGIWAYRTDPSCAVAGFRTEQAAYKNWLVDQFGDRGAKAIIKLLRASK